MPANHEYDPNHECPHAHVREVRSNSGDGTRQYDFTTLVCDDCDEEL